MKAVHYHYNSRTKNIEHDARLLQKIGRDYLMLLFIQNISPILIG